MPSAAPCGPDRRCSRTDDSAQDGVTCGFRTTCPYATAACTLAPYPLISPNAAWEEDLEATGARAGVQRRAIATRLGLGRGTDDDLPHVDVRRLLDGERDGASDRRRRDRHLVPSPDDLGFHL